MKILLLLLFKPFLTQHNRFRQNYQHCERIKPKYKCAKYYNLTTQINLLNHNDQAAANYFFESTIEHFTHAENTCHPYLEELACSFLFPQCRTDLPGYSHIPPCREFCQNVKQKCGPKMKSHGFSWPNNMQCTGLPSSKESKPCLPAPVNGKRQSLTNLNVNCFDGQVQCPAHLWISEKNPNTLSRNRYTFLSTNEREVPICGAPCDSIESKRLFWTEGQRRITRVLIAIFSSFSLLITAFAIATYLTDSTRFRYPEKPIVWLAGCYFCISMSYLLGALSNNDLACSDLQVGQKIEERAKIITQGTDRAWCTMSFMLLYFFTLAAGVWWIVLALTWLLAAWQKWSSEAIERVSQYFHFFAWGMPTVLTLIILSHGKVDGDSLSGVCFTGQLNSATLYNFVFVPLLVCLITGFLCLFWGFIALYKIRKSFKSEKYNNSGPTDATDPGHPLDPRTNIQKLEGLIVKIGLFSIMYVILMAIVLLCYWYETQNFNEWIDGWLVRQNKMYESSTVPSYCNLKSNEEYLLNTKPEHLVFLTKYAIQLSLGMICGLWVWSYKTVHQWANMCGCGTKLYTDGQLTNRGSTHHIQMHNQVVMQANPPSFQPTFESKSHIYH